LRTIGFQNTFYIEFNFFAAWLAYNYPRMIYGFSNKSETKSERNFWYIKNKYLLLSTTLVSVIILGYDIQFLNTQQILLLSISSFFTLFYVAPVTFLKSLRNIPFLKPFLIASCWISITYLLPLFQYQNNVIDTSIISNQWILVFITALLFDFRDREVDKQIGLKTFANQFDAKHLKLFCILLTFVRLTFFAFTNHLCVEILFSTLLIVLICFTNIKRTDFYYLCAIDGALVIYPTLMLLYETNTCFIN
jgi:4-hydroxybenzoate polyprenyltransferase